MSWRSKLSWQWIIRGTCLGVLGLCVGAWGLSYVFGADVFHKGSSDLLLQVDSGMLRGTWVRPITYRAAPAGWHAAWNANPRGMPFDPHLFGGDIMGFSVTRDPGASYIGIPLWFPTLLLAVASWIAWRRTGRGETARGFPVEPLASRPEIAGG